MPISFKTDIEWGSSWYLKSDPDQQEYILVGVLVEPTDDPKRTRLKFALSFCGEIVTVLPCECTETKDLTKSPVDDD